jgi:hypothetical protein
MKAYKQIKTPAQPLWVTMVSTAGRASNYELSEKGSHCLKYFWNL